MQKDFDLFGRIITCELCPRLVELRENTPGYRHVVPAEVGKDYQPRGLAFMAEAPGQEEAEVGLPLQARPTGKRRTAGSIFNDMLADAGIERESLLILNRVRCRPFENKLDNFPEALHNCEKWNIEELQTYNPSVVVVMGNTAMRGVYGPQARISDMRAVRQSKSDKHNWGSPEGRIFIPTYHPAAVLRNPNLRDGVVEDFISAYNDWRETQ